VRYALDCDALQKRCFFAMACMLRHMHRRHAALLNILFGAGLQAHGFFEMPSNTAPAWENVLDASDRGAQRRAW
jgi:hypothetical protein